jgi:hypothetical protein
VYGYKKSPDGRHIALGLWSQQEPQSTLELVSVSGESYKLPGAWGPPLWFSDSHQFLYLATNELWLASVSGEQPRHLGKIDLPTGMRPMAAALHPGGTRLALIAEEPFRYEVWVINEPAR